MSIHVVVMGVAGSGKSTVSEAIRDRLGFDMAEGDDFHPQHNIDKMTAGIPLTDEDRWPWLRVINTWMVAKDAIDHNSVVSSSALKRSYRDVLRDGVDVFFVHLAGDFDDVYAHMKARQNHFMPVSLLKSQYEDLQPLEAAAAVAMNASVETRTRFVAWAAQLRLYGLGDQLEMFHEIDQLFHSTILQESHNEFFASLASTIDIVLAGRVEIGMYPPKPKLSAIENHEAVAEAIMAQNPEHARTAMRRIVDEVSASLY